MSKAVTIEDYAPRALPPNLTPAQLTRVILMAHDMVLTWAMVRQKAIREGTDQSLSKAMLSRATAELTIARTRLALAMLSQDRRS